MRVTKELIYEILRIAEDTVEDATTERVFFGYDGTDELTFEGQQAYDRIVMAFRVAEIRAALPDHEVIHLWGLEIDITDEGETDGPS